MLRNWWAVTAVKASGCGFAAQISCASLKKAMLRGAVRGMIAEYACWQQSVVSLAADRRI
jgi:hypothetical protein